MGKITQLAFGALHPGNMNVNLMSANVTAVGLDRRREPDGGGARHWQSGPEFVKKLLAH